MAARYLASAGHDSIVNMFDLSEWICMKTITTSECVQDAYHSSTPDTDTHAHCSHPITGLSFSYDGEFIALSTQGPYIDIVGHFPTSPRKTSPLTRFSVVCNRDWRAPPPRALPRFVANCAMASLEIRRGVLWTNRAFGLGVDLALRTRDVNVDTSAARCIFLGRFIHAILFTNMSEPIRKRVVNYVF